MKPTALDFLTNISYKLLKAAERVLAESGQSPREAHVSFEDFAQIEQAANAQIRTIANLILVPDIQCEPGKCFLLLPKPTVRKWTLTLREG